MTESQREPVPMNDDGELEVALEFLRFARHCLVKKAHGLNDEDLRRVLVPSGTSLLGLVHHCAVGERWWFGYHFDPHYPDVDWDFEAHAPRNRTAEQVLADHAAAVEASDAVIARLGDMEALTARDVRDRPRTLRWVMAHVTSEVARHAGHADILREQIDGVTGR
jgi:hypothetical protein